jgi:four helix bundle protein
MQDFRNLRVWHAAHDLSLQVIKALPPKVCRAVPGLRSQAIRAATSVPWNIAEGCKCSSQREFLQFLETALSSLTELEAQLITARDARLFTARVYARLQASIVMVRRMLIALARKVERDLTEEQPVTPDEPGFSSGMAIDSERG